MVQRRELQRVVLTLIRLAGAAVLAAALLAGCSAVEPNVGGSGVPSASSHPSAAASESVSPSVIARPFGAVTQLADEHARDFHDRAESATARCMADRGFTYTPIPYRPKIARGTRLGDVAFAAEHGFGEAAEGPPRFPDDTQGLTRTEAAAWGDALLGQMSGSTGPEDPNLVVIDGLPGGGTMMFRRDGCAALGEESVYGDIARWRSADAHFRALSNEVYTAIEADPEWVAAETEWARCMTDAGYGAYLAEGRNGASSMLISELTGGRRATPDTPLQLDEVGDLRMRELAVASATCERDGGMAERYTRLQDIYVESVTERSQGVIAAYVELINTGVASGDRSRVNR